MQKLHNCGSTYLYPFPVMPRGLGDVIAALSSHQGYSDKNTFHFNLRQLFPLSHPQISSYLKRRFQWESTTARPHVNRKISLRNRPCLAYNVPNSVILLAKLECCSLALTFAQAQFVKSTERPHGLLGLR